MYFEWGWAGAKGQEVALIVMIRKFDGRMEPRGVATETSGSGGRDCGQSAPRLMRQGIGVHAEARVDGENADGDSCSAPVRLRWRAKQELRGREPFDHVHGSATDWTLP